MFGKPEWFEERALGWGLHPLGWRGWVYGLAWISAIAIPFAGMVSRRQGPEALIWLAASAGLFIWDVAGIRRTLRNAVESEVLYIGDDGECRTKRMASPRV